MQLFLIVTIFVHSVYTGELSLSKDAIQAVNNLAKSWKAGNGFGESTSVDINSLVAPLSESIHKNDFPVLTNGKDSAKFGKTFDARYAWPKCPSLFQRHDQRKGVPSWVYATVATFADRLCIKHGIQIDVEATVERIAKANGGFTSNSADISQAFHYWSKEGILTVRSVNGTDCLPSTRCEEIQFDKYFNVDVKRPVNISDLMEDIMQNGPLTMQIQVYSDLPYYTGGAYKQTTDKILGTQAVKVIGWGYSQGQWYWLVTNSWGVQWGAKGGYWQLMDETPYFGPDSYALSPTFTPADLTKVILKQDQMFDLA